MSNYIVKKIQTSEYNQYFDITDQIIETIKQNNIKDSLITIMSPHTTCGVYVNEGLECLEKDIELFLNNLVPEEDDYHHARMLDDYGSTAGNVTGHLKSLICGNHAHLLIKDGEVIKGDAQRVYFCEFDGPSMRKYYIIY